MRNNYPYKNYTINTKLLFIRLCLNAEGNLIFYSYICNKKLGLAIYSLSSCNLFDIEFSYENSR